VAVASARVQEALKAVDVGIIIMFLLSMGSGGKKVMVAVAVVTAVVDIFHHML